MKHTRLTVLLLSVLLCLGLFTSCGGSGLTDEEISDIYRDLVEASYELNDIYYGDGLPFQHNESVMAYLTGIQEGTEGFRVSYMPVAEDSPSLASALA